MKSELTNLVLMFVLGAFVVFDVIFAVRAIDGQRGLRSLQIKATQAQTGLMRIQQLRALANDAMAYNQKNPNPELTRILNAAQSKPAQTKPAAH